MSRMILHRQLVIIDNKKCEPYFGRYRGCNVCIKVCAAALRKEGLIS